MRRSRTVGTGGVVVAGSVRGQEPTSGEDVTLAAGRSAAPAVEDSPGTVDSESEL